MDIGWILLTLAIGVVVGWLSHAARSSRAVRDAELESTRLNALAEAAEREAVMIRERAEADVRAAQDRAAEQVAAARIEQERAAEQFKALAGEALEANTKQFLTLAEQRLSTATVKNEEQLAQREQAVKNLVDPLSRVMDKVRAQVEEAEKARAQGHGQLTEQLRQVTEESAKLRSGTSDLVAALRTSEVRGAWGELQLRRTVEAAGMLNRVDFTEQDQFTSDTGVLRPDMVIHLAGAKNVVVDSKVAFIRYLEAQQTDDVHRREQLLDAHVKHMRKHVDELAGKKYWAQFDAAPEFVVMFVPAEAFLSAAVEQQPDLLEYAARKNVILATPMTLIALLRTVAFAWRQEALAENAAKVHQVGKELHSRLVTMTGHVTKMGRSLESSTKDYNKLIGSLERNVLSSARKMVALEVVDPKDAIAEPREIEEVPRPITRSELLVADEGGVVAIESARDTASREESASGPASGAGAAILDRSPDPDALDAVVVQQVEVTELAATDQRALAEVEKKSRAQATGN
ncbi:DNA recombination protein RmuC [Myceligenerans sp. I2]|uniref:DNA recombination protein RmuC n=2 Tax=Myceligenerans indicum TaxID=2593663 RepID=A0ABS1LFC1_9MICO|nr:DNA recombination protein RmuC [Myceligenerans indicum]